MLSITKANDPEEERIERMSTTDRGEPIDITRYAEVMAHLRHFPTGKHAEVIARLGIRRRDWDAAATKWRRVRDGERVTGNLEVTIRFGRIVADTRAKLDARQPSIESLGPFPGPDGAPADPTAPAAPKAKLDDKPDEASAVAAPMVQVPSYVAAELRAAAQPPPPPPLAPRPPAYLASTVLGSSAPAAAAMPFSAPSGSAHADSVQGPAESRRESVGSGTVAAMGDEGAAAAPPPGIVALTLEQYASLRIELEGAPDRIPAILGRYGLPPDGRAALDAHWKARFTADPVLRMTFARAYANYQAWLKANPAPRVSPLLAATTPLPAPGAPATTAMPFTAPVGSAAETYQRAVAHAGAVQGPTEPRHAAVGSGTVAVADEGTGGAPTSGVAVLTLEQYASLRVELETAPDRIAATLGRYGVAPDGRPALDAHWKGRFSADPVLGMTFARKYAEVVVWFKANPGWSRP
jgi:hypothetical protein